MAIRLDDAEIKIKLDKSEIDAQLNSLEKKTDEIGDARKKQNEEDERRARIPGREPMGAAGAPAQRDMLDVGGIRTQYEQQKGRASRLAQQVEFAAEVAGITGALLGRGLKEIPGVGDQLEKITLEITGKVIEKVETLTHAMDTAKIVAQMEVTRQRLGQSVMPAGEFSDLVINMNEFKAKMNTMQHAGRMKEKAIMIETLTKLGLNAIRR